MSQRPSKMANGSNKASGTTPSEDKQKRILAQNTGHFSMVRALHLADLITLGNGFCGIMSIFSSLRYCLDQSASTTSSLLSPAPAKTNLWLALSFMPFGLFFDFLDGRVARWRQKSSLMGAQLDSLADLISFGVSPAAAAFALGIRTDVDHFLLCFFALCGLARLARFNVTTGDVPHDASGKAKYFEGTPIPSSLGIAAWMAVWVWNGWIHADIPFGVWGAGTAWAFHPVALVFVAHGCAMVSKTLHVPKP